MRLVCLLSIFLYIILHYPIKSNEHLLKENIFRIAESRIRILHSALYVNPSFVLIWLKFHDTLADFMTPSEQLFKDLNWLPFPKRVQYHTCLMVYKSISAKAPEYIFSMLTYVSEHYGRQTRSTALDLLHIPRSHSAYFDRAFSVQGPKLWDSLPADIRNSTSINRIKSDLTRFFFFFFFFFFFALQ